MRRDATLDKALQLCFSDKRIDELRGQSKGLDKAVQLCIFETKAWPRGVTSFEAIRAASSKRERSGSKL